MPNYAIPSSGGVNQWQDYYRNQYSNLPELSRQAFDWNPELGYENMMQSLKPTNATDSALRRLYQTMWNRYNVFSGTSPIGSKTTWGEWLGNQDLDRLLASYSPSFRGEADNRFNRPARYIAF